MGSAKPLLKLPPRNKGRGASRELLRPGPKSKPAAEAYASASGRLAPTPAELCIASKQLFLLTGDKTGASLMQSCTAYVLRICGLVIGVTRASVYLSVQSESNSYLRQERLQRQKAQVPSRNNQSLTCICVPGRSTCQSFLLHDFCIPLVQVGR